MGFNKILYSLPVRVILLAGGGALISGGALEWGKPALVCGIVLVLVAILLMVKVYVAMKESSRLMLESIKNGDNTFKLNSRGMYSYERILQDTLNRFGELLGQQKLLMEQREHFFGLILATVTTGIVVLDSNDKIIQTNPAVTELLHLPVFTSLQQLNRYGDNLSDIFRNIVGGERKQVDFTTATGDVHLLVKATEMQLGNEHVKILGISDIKNELDAKELDTWIKLTRVLTHEIMNSVAPIASLSGTFLEKEGVKYSNIGEGLQAIHDTANGLISFVNNYRIISTLQKPSPKPFYLKEMLSSIQNLNLIPHEIECSCRIEPHDLMIYADPDLIRQVLINILKNAVQAIGGQKGKIHIKACVSANGCVYVYISNDGPIIPNEEAETIFVPFFTTRKDGNGVGLSLSRQIMKLSGGSISLLNAGTNGWNTTFLLEFE